ncbi:MAG: ankyrin repeat domain-containing protein [Sterolibacteriaceae bacterium MAG5]|nr:ankyrin repeat domain-containing protein [Candidatus Nitricoxidireducens bremensis]
MSRSSAILAGLLTAAVLVLAGCGKGDEGEPPANPATEGAFVRPLGEISALDAKLFEAAGKGDTDAVEEAIEEGADLNAVDKLKRTPLFGAAFYNRVGTVRLLAERGADVNAKDFSGFAPLHAAVAAGSREAVAALVAKGADVNDRVVGGRTPLHLAAATNQPLMVEFLLGNGASPQIKDNEGHTPAALASLNGHKAVRDQIKHWIEARKAPKK